MLNDGPKLQALRLRRRNRSFVDVNIKLIVTEPHFTHFMTTTSRSTDQRNIVLKDRALVSTARTSSRHPFLRFYRTPRGVLPGKSPVSIARPSFQFFSLLPASSRSVGMKCGRELSFIFSDAHMQYQLLSTICNMCSTCQSTSHKEKKS
jgi:hypothetical protein